MYIRILQKEQSEVTLKRVSAQRVSSFCFQLFAYFIHFHVVISPNIAANVSRYLRFNKFRMFSRLSQ